MLIIEKNIVTVSSVLGGWVIVSSTGEATTISSNQDLNPTQSLELFRWIKRVDGDGNLKNQVSSKLSKTERRKRVGLKKNSLDREKELTDGFIFNDLFFNVEILKTFESAIGKAKRRGSSVRWINVQKTEIFIGESEAQAIADAVSDKIEDIYFKYLEIEKGLQ